MSLEICLTTHLELLASWNMVLYIFYSSLVGFIASRFNIARYVKLLVSGNKILLDIAKYS